MLIICYGITKSGSTLTFELVNGMLATAGHKQKRLPDGLVSPGHGVNFLEKVDAEAIEKLLAVVPEGGFVCVKTHARIDKPLFRMFEELQAQRKVQVIASYRDPRDICLAMVDAGARARAKGLQGFSQTTDLASAVPRIERQIITFRIWASIRGAVRLGYDLVAFTPDKAIDILEKTLGITCDREAAKKYAFEEAFTQKNKAVKDRHTTELTAQEKKDLEQAFDKFLRRVIKRNDEEWFTSYREKFLMQGAGEEPARNP